MVPTIRNRFLHREGGIGAESSPRALVLSLPNWPPEDHFALIGTGRQLARPLPYVAGKWLLDPPESPVRSFGFTHFWARNTAVIALSMSYGEVLPS